MNFFKGAYLLFLIVVFSINIKAQSTDEFIGEYNNLYLRVKFYSNSIVRISISQSKIFPNDESLSVIKTAENIVPIQKVGDGNIELSNKDIKLVIDNSSKEIIFYDLAGKQLLKSFLPEGKSFKPLPDINDGYSLEQKFRLTKDEAIYGLGQYEDGVLNWRGIEVLVEQSNRIAVNPFFVSTNNYGIFWDNYSRTVFDDSKEETIISSEAGKMIDYYFVYGSGIDNVISGYRDLTGQAPMFGRWAYGFWQSKERYKNEEELLSVTEEYRRREIPIDNIVQDWHYWGDENYFSGMRWDKENYPDPKSWIEKVHKNNFHIMVSIWPAFGKSSDIYKEMESKNLLFAPEHWGSGKLYDAYNPEAREIYWKYVKTAHYNNGMDAYWMDGSEPEIRCSDDRHASELAIKSLGTNYLGSFTRFLNPYSLMTTKGLYEQHRKTTDDKRVFILTRSAFGGQQRYASVTWSGDTFASWDNLKIQIAAGINFSMSGIPYWNSDIGAFITSANYPTGNNDPAYRELYVRWFQFGAFSPMFRAHGTNIPREMWQFGDKGDWAYEAQVKIDKLRYSLMPYLYSTAWEITNAGYSFIRPLAAQFPDDKKCFDLAGQYMFGSSIMVAPITKNFLIDAKAESVDISPEHFYSPDGKEMGLDLQIFKGTEFNKLVQERKIESGQIRWFGCLPLEVADTAYSLIMEGMLQSENKGEYSFNINTDHGVKFFINDSLLIDKWDNTELNDFSAKIYLDGNKKYHFRAEHKQTRTRSATFKITWIRPHAASKQNVVYLPKGINWYDLLTGEKFNGGKEIETSVAINYMPLFVPEGSIIPLSPGIQYASQKEDPLEIRIYQGKDGRFELYEDENDNYNYENGFYSIIGFNWDNDSRTLTIGKRKGEFKGMLNERNFKIVLVNKDHGVGSQFTPLPDKEIKYVGNEVKIKL